MMRGEARSFRAPFVFDGYGNDLTIEWLKGLKRPTHFVVPKTYIYWSPEAGGDYPLGNDANDGLSPSQAVASCGAVDALLDATPNSIVLLDAEDTFDLGATDPCIDLELGDAACIDWLVCYGIESSDPTGVRKPTIITDDVNGGDFVLGDSLGSDEERTVFYVANLKAVGWRGRDFVSALPGGVSVLIGNECAANVSEIGASDSGHCSITKSLGIAIVLNSTFTVDGPHAQADSVASHFAWVGNPTEGLGGIAMNVAYEIEDTTYIDQNIIRASGQPAFWIGGTLHIASGAMTDFNSGSAGLYLMGVSATGAASENNGAHIEVSDLTLSSDGPEGAVTLARFSGCAQDSIARAYEITDLAGGTPIRTTNCGGNTNGAAHEATIRYAYFPKSGVERDVSTPATNDWMPMLLYQGGEQFQDLNGHKIDISHIVTDQNPSSGMNGSASASAYLGRYFNPGDNVTYAEGCEGGTTSMVGAWEDRYTTPNPFTAYLGGPMTAFCSSALDLSISTPQRSRAAIGGAVYLHDFWNAGHRNGSPRADNDRLRIPREFTGGVELRGVYRSPRNYGSRNE